MTVVTVTKGIALIIFAISCVTIYHNTNSYEKSKRIIYIIIRKYYNVWTYFNALYDKYERTRS